MNGAFVDQWCALERGVGCSGALKRALAGRREVEVAEWRVSKQIGKFYSHVLDNIVADALGCLELHFEGSGVARDSNFT